MTILEALIVDSVMEREESSRRPETARAESGLVGLHWRRCGGGFAEKTFSGHRLPVGMEGNVFEGDGIILEFHRREHGRGNIHC